MSIDGFTSFLLSPENSALSSQNAKVFHDMTRPLSEYYISSSHNTYLVGHQLVGVSTVEGYIRALLHGCRSVERTSLALVFHFVIYNSRLTVDIYDGETEPVVYHGKTLTSKLSVREICLAIAKYAFVTSPYPVIISAEIHCGQGQQDMIVAIMTEVFGDTLVTAPIEGRPKIDQLPSPEDLKGRVLLKVRSLIVDRNHVSHSTNRQRVCTHQSTSHCVTRTSFWTLNPLQQRRPTAILSTNSRPNSIRHGNVRLKPSRVRHL